MPRWAACTGPISSSLQGARHGQDLARHQYRVQRRAAPVRDNEDGIDDAKSLGAGVAFFSLEMSADQLATRILAEQSGISGENLRMGKISQHDFRNLARAAAELERCRSISTIPGLP